MLVVLVTAPDLPAPVTVPTLKQSFITPPLAGNIDATLATPPAQPASSVAVIVPVLPQPVMAGAFLAAAALLTIPPAKPTTPAALEAAVTSAWFRQFTMVVFVLARPTIPAASLPVVITLPVTVRSCTLPLVFSRPIRPWSFLVLLM